LLDLAEAERVRALGWRGPILLLEGCFEPARSGTVLALALWPRRAPRGPDRLGWPPTRRSTRTACSEMNSGMNRLGLRPERYRSAWCG